MIKPAASEGMKQSANLRIGVPIRRKPRKEESRTNSALPTAAAVSPANSQICSQYSCKRGVEDSTADNSPIAPKAIPAEPGTAKDAAPSMQSRM